MFGYAVWCPFFILFLGRSVSGAKKGSEEPHTREHVRRQSLKNKRGKREVAESQEKEALDWVLVSLLPGTAQVSLRASVPANVK